MKKFNNKGFALVETLIVSAFVVGIFSVMYVNFYPMMGEYEKRENYDDINSIYNANLIKKLIENKKTDIRLRSYISSVSYSYDSYIELDEYIFRGDEYYSILTKSLNIDNIYLTKYNLTTLKNDLNSLNNFDIQTREYIEYLPNYEQNKYNLQCRIIVKYKADANKESSKKSGQFKYATIGVDCS